MNWIAILLRPRLLAEEASLKFALFVLPISGIAWEGIMGLFCGPVIMLLLVTTIDIYVERYAREDGSALDRAFRNLGKGPGAGESATELEEE